MGIYIVQNGHKMTWVRNGDLNLLQKQKLCEQGQRLESGLIMSIKYPRSSL
jgi:hypothetical protein